MRTIGELAGLNEEAGAAPIVSWNEGDQIVPPEKQAAALSDVFSFLEQLGAEDQSRDALQQDEPEVGEPQPGELEVQELAMGEPEPEQLAAAGLDPAELEAGPADQPEWMLPEPAPNGESRPPE